MSRTTPRLPLYSGILLFTFCLAGCANGPGRYIAKLWSRSTVLTDEQAVAMQAEQQDSKSRVVANAAIANKTDEPAGRVNLADLEKQPAPEKKQILAGFFPAKEDKQAEPESDKQQATANTKKQAPKKNKPRLVLPYQELVTGSITQKALNNQQKDQSESENQNSFADDFDKRLAQLRSSITQDAFAVDQIQNDIAENKKPSAQPKQKSTPASKLKQIDNSDQAAATRLAKKTIEPVTKPVETIDQELFDAIDRELSKNEAKLKQNAEQSQASKEEVVLLPDPQLAATENTPLKITKPSADDSQFKDPFFEQQFEPEWVETPASEQNITAKTSEAAQSISENVTPPADNTPQFQNEHETAGVADAAAGRQFQSSTEMLIDTKADISIRSRPNRAVSLNTNADFSTSKRSPTSEQCHSLFDPRHPSSLENRAPTARSSKLVTTKTALQKSQLLNPVPDRQTRSKSIQLQADTGMTRQVSLSPQLKPTSQYDKKHQVRSALPVIVPRSPIRQLAAEAQTSANHSADLTIPEEPLHQIEENDKTAPAFLQLGEPIFENSETQREPEQAVEDSGIKPIAYEEEATLTPILEPVLLVSPDAETAVVEKESSHAKLFVLACALAVVIGVILRYRSDYLAEQ